MGNVKSVIRKRKRKAIDRTAGSSASLPSASTSDSNRNHNSNTSNNEDECYHKPNNNEEIDRLQEQDFIIQYIFQSRFSSPIEQLLLDGARVLDIGCGPGTWMLDMATVYENTLFFGIDCVPSFPMEIKPPNVIFQQDNILDGITMRDDSIDFVRIAVMSMSFTPEEYMQAVHEAVRVLKPGGYIEAFEVEHVTHYDGPMTDRFMNKFLSIITSKGISLDTPLKIPESFESTNKLGEVNIRKKRVIMGEKGGKEGVLFLNSMEYFFTNIGELMAGVMDMSVPEYLEYWKGVREEYETYTASLCFSRFWAQKV